MRYNIVINQLQCIKYNLNVKQGALMDLIGQLNTWAEDEKIEGKIYYNLAYSKVIAELPLIFNSKDRVYRASKVLEKEGLIELVKVGSLKKNFVRLTPKGKLFFSVVKKTETECVSSKKTIRFVKKTETQKELLNIENQLTIRCVPSKKPTYNNNTTNDKHKKGVRELNLKEYAAYIGNYFGKTSEVQLMKVYGFLNSQIKNELPEFKIQFEAYKKYKANTGEKIHRFESFCNEWNEQDWNVLLKNSMPQVDVVKHPALKRIS